MAEEKELPTWTEDGFLFGGTDITNPSLSECGRFVGDTDYYGFYEIDTGGGGKALYLELADGYHILLTDIGGLNVPEREVGRFFLMGLYDTEGQDVWCLTKLWGVMTEGDDADVYGFVGRLAEHALDAAALHIQTVLGVETGDLAGLFFSGGEATKVLEGYINSELIQMGVVK